MENEYINNIDDGEPITEMQIKISEIMSRIDEIDRVLEYTNDEHTIEYIKARKKELRSESDTIFNS